MLRGQWPHLSGVGHPAQEGTEVGSLKWGGWTVVGSPLLGGVKA